MKYNKTYRKKASRQKTDIYQLITDKIVAALESGVGPWIQPWDDSKVAFDVQCWNKSEEGIRIADIGIDSTTGELALTNIVQITTGIDNLAVIDWLPSWPPTP